MNKSSLVTFIICLLHFAAAKRGFLLTSPKSLRSETTETLSLKLFEVDADGVVIVQLRSPNHEEILSETVKNITNGEGSTLSLTVPHTTQEKGWLMVSGKFATEDEYTFSGEEEVYIKSSIIVFIQTDKPVYKPGQTVKFRILLLTTDLTPANYPIRKMKVWIENSDKLTVAQWSEYNIEAFYQLELPLSEEPTFGEWRIFTNISDHHYTQTFEVKEYVLPKFEVNILPPPYIILGSSVATFNICATYTYGEKVEGRLRIKSVLDVEKRYQHEEIYEGEISGCYQYHLEIPKLYLRARDYIRNTPHQIVVHAEVTEIGTDIKQNSSVTTRQHKYPVKLTFVESSGQKYYKKGLPYKGLVKVASLDGAVLADQDIEMTYLFVQEPYVDIVDIPHNVWNPWVSEMLKSDSDGLVHFTIPAKYDSSRMISVSARYLDQENKTELASEVSLDIKPWFSPSGSFLQTQPMKDKLSCGEIYNISLLYTSISEGRPVLNYQVASRGKIHVDRSQILNVAEHGNSSNSTGNSVPQWEETNIQLEVTPAMFPAARLLVYYVREDGEVVADNSVLKINPCFQHKVNMKFNDTRQYPGSPAYINLEVDPYSVCGVGVVDKSIHFLKSNNQLTKERVVEALERIDSTSKYPNDVRKKACKRSSFHSFSWLSSYEDAFTAFQESGIIAIGNLDLVTRPCYEFFEPPPWIPRPDWIPFGGPDYESEASSSRRTSPHPELVTVAPETNIGVNEEKDSNLQVDIRSYFPETWLWEAVRIGEGGAITIKRDLPHTITEWVGSAVCLNLETGLGVSDPTSITGFQPFFVSFSLPYSATRGEKIPIVVSVFNYLSQCLPIQLTLETNDTFSILDDYPIAVICVCGGKSKTHQFMVVPEAIGELNITVYGNSLPEDNEVCSGEDTTAITARDAATRQLLVLPEGFPQEVNYNGQVCPGIEGEQSRRIRLNIPPFPVEGSVRAYFSVFGDLMGPTITGLERLVQLPTGCGEQNMILFVPNIVVLDYLTSSGGLTADIADKAKSHLSTGYQRQLNYRHQDGSYSAFGTQDKEGSIWLTAFVLKAFSRAQRYITIDKQDLERSHHWLISKQRSDGCFPVIGRLVHSELQGGLGGSQDPTSPLTAYIIISLLEAGYSDPEVVKKALSCLEKDKNPATYALALYAYAESLTDQSSSSGYLVRLMELAVNTGRTTYWLQSSKSSEIETAAYVVLALVQRGGADNTILAQSVVRWIAEQRNAQGGFVSTQDTVIGLQALARYSSYVGNIPVNLNLTARNGDWEDNFIVNENNKKVVQRVKMSNVTGRVQVEAAGLGCAMFQVNLRYNVPTRYDIRQPPAFSLNITATRRKSALCDKADIEACVRYLPVRKPSNMAVIQVNMVSGFVPNKNSLKMLVSDSAIQRYDATGNEVFLYFNELSNEPLCVSFVVEETVRVEDASPATAKVFDYYDSEKFEFVKYIIPESCSQDNRPESSDVPLGFNRTTLEDPITSTVPSASSTIDPHRETTNEGSHTTQVEPSTSTPASSTTDHHTETTNGYSPDETSTESVVTTTRDHHTETVVETT